MRRTVVLTGVGALAVAGAVIAATVTTADAQGRSGRDHGHGHPDRHHHTVSFTVVEHADTDTTTDTGAKGDSVGDILTFANPVFDAKNTKQVGTDNGSCLRTVVGKAYECSWTTTLSGGSLVVEGPFYDTKDSVLAITGGTGKYARAHGEMTLHARDAKGSSYDFGFRVG